MRLHELYQQVRIAREKRYDQDPSCYMARTKVQQPQDWLCALEILQIVKDSQIKVDIKTYLEDKLDNDQEHAKLIEDGLALIV